MDAHREGQGLSFVVIIVLVQCNTDECLRMIVPFVYGNEGMMKNQECLKCGSPLLHFIKEREMKCVECGKVQKGNIACQEGHFICDSCHSKLGIDWVMKEIGKCSSKNPIDIVRQAMNGEHVHMHGNEHHVIVGAALITAYHNAGGQVDLSACLSEMKARGSRYPGGACGFWGACGAAVSAGMFMSIVTGATPLTESTWGFANRVTANALSRMADIGGPRCCKRNSFIAIETAANLTSKLLGLEMELPEKISCDYFEKNNQCIKKRCPYYPLP